MNKNLRSGLVLFIFCTTNHQYLFSNAAIGSEPISPNKSCFLRLDTSRGELSVETINTTSNNINVNLDKLFSHREPRFVFFGSFNAIRISPDSVEKKQNFNEDAFDGVDYIWAGLRGRYSIPREKSTRELHRAIELKSGEGFSKTVNIWQIHIWDELKEFCKTNSQRKYRLEYSKVEELSDVLGTEIESLTIDIDGAMVLKLAKLQANVNTLPRTEKPLTDLIDSRLTYDEKTQRFVLSITNRSDFFATINLDQHEGRSFAVTDAAKSSNDVTPTTTEQGDKTSENENRVVDLDTGETFIWSFAITDTDVVSTLRGYFSEDKKRRCSLSTTIAFQVGGKSLSCEPQLPVNWGLFQKMAR